MRYNVILLTIAMLLVGCKSIPQHYIEYRDRVHREAAVEKIVNRTITKPEVSYVTVEKLVTLPPDLYADCGITDRANKKVGEYVRVAEVNTAYLVDCRGRMKEIKRRQEEAIAAEASRKAPQEPSKP